MQGLSVCGLVVVLILSSWATICGQDDFGVVAAQDEVTRLEAALESAPPHEKPYWVARIANARNALLSHQAQEMRASWNMQLNHNSEFASVQADVYSLLGRIHLADESEEEDGDDDIVSSTQELRRLAGRARLRFGMISSLLESFEVAERDLARLRDLTLDKRETLDERFGPLEEEARKLAGGQWGVLENTGDTVWSTLRSDATGAIGELYNMRRDLLIVLRGGVTTIAKVQDACEENNQWMRHKLLWTRQDTAISAESIRKAAGDLTTILRDAWSAGVAAVRQAREHVLDSRHRVRAIAGGLGMLIFFSGLLVFMRRRDEREGAVESQDSSGESAQGVPGVPFSRAIRVLRQNLKETRYSLFVALLLVGFPLAAGVEFASWGWVAVICSLPFCYRFLGVMLKLVLEPDSAVRRWVPLDDNISSTLFRSARYVLRLSGAYLLILSIVRLAGYQTQNPGFVELLTLLYKFSTYLVLLITLFRPSVLRGLIRGEGLLARSAKTVVLFAYPLVVIAVATIVVLDALRYDTAATEFRLAMLKSVLIGAVAYVVYRRFLWLSTGGRNLGRRCVQDEFEEEEAYLAAGRSLFIDRAIRLVLCLIMGLPAVMLILDAWPELGFNVLDISLSGSDGGITLGNLVWASISGVATFLVVKLYKQFMMFVVMPTSSLDKGLRYTLTTLTSYVVIGVGVVVTLTLINVQGDQIAMVTGALVFGIGFGLQTIVKNLFSGLILLLERPVKVGDRIVVGASSGVVEKITMRATTVMTWDGNSLIIPNEEMIGSVLNNESVGNLRLRTRLNIGVGYGSDPRKVEELLLAALSSHDEIMTRPGPQVLFTGFGDSSLDFEMRFWTRLSTNRTRVASDMRYAIEKTLRENGIEIPFPQQDLNIRSVDPGVAGALGTPGPQGGA